MKKTTVLLAVLFMCSVSSIQAKQFFPLNTEALAKGKIEPVKTAFVKKEVKPTGIQIENKHILVKIDYTGKIYDRRTMFASR